MNTESLIVVVSQGSSCLFQHFGMRWYIEARWFSLLERKRAALSKRFYGQQEKIFDSEYL